MAISAVTSYLGSRSQSNAASDAADAQAQAAMYAADIQMQMFNTANQNSAMFRHYGQNAMQDMAYNGQDINVGGTIYSSDDGYWNAANEAANAYGNFEMDENDPVYKYKQQKMEESINRNLAARGKSNSRAGVNMLMDGNMSLASEEADKQYNRYTGEAMNRFNMLNAIGNQRYGRDLNMANIGIGAAGQMSNNAMTTGQGLANSYTQIGNAQAQNYLTQGQSQANMWNSLGQMPMNAATMALML
ncbi:MAG: hypothetical protein GY845_30345 [Planctomycetes bacterium]|nr:hypothetical protein [Planctomycetota bacterium]